MTTRKQVRKMSVRTLHRIIKQMEDVNKTLLSKLDDLYVVRLEETAKLRNLRNVVNEIRGIIGHDIDKMTDNELKITQILSRNSLFAVRIENVEEQNFIEGMNNLYELVQSQGAKVWEQVINNTGTFQWKDKK